jgi:RNA polymerase sigma-70 factor (ECF subfamily)
MRKAVAVRPTASSQVLRSGERFSFGKRLELGEIRVPLSDLDRTLLAHCFQKRPFAWESFVDRFLMLVVFVVQHTARRRQVPLTEHDLFELVSDVFLSMIREDFSTLRRFRGKSSLATYLTVVSRRVVVRKLIRLHRGPRSEPSGSDSAPEQFSARDVESALDKLAPREASVARMFHLEHQPLDQISQATGLGVDAVQALLEEVRRKIQAGFGVAQQA